MQPKINKHSAADPNACALCFCLGYSGPFVRDTSPKSIDREGLGESRTGTRQGKSLWHREPRTSTGSRDSRLWCLIHSFHLKSQVVYTEVRALLLIGRAWNRAKSRKFNINFRLTFVAQKRLCLSSLISAEELGTYNLRRITSVWGPIWGIHSLTLINSCL